VLTSKCSKTVIMTMKENNSDLNIKLEMIYLCENASSSKIGIERWYGLNFSALFMTLKKRKYGIY
jgi:hypothetical protein